MTLQGRLMLFILSSLSTVIIPAVMISLYHTLTDVMGGDQMVIAVLGLIPLLFVMVICFTGIFYSIFKVKPLHPAMMAKRKETENGEQSR